MVEYIFSETATKTNGEIRQYQTVQYTKHVDSIQEIVFFKAACFSNVQKAIYSILNSNQNPTVPLQIKSKAVMMLSSQNQFQRQSQTWTFL